MARNEITSSSSLQNALEWSLVDRLVDAVQPIEEPANVLGSNRVDDDVVLESLADLVDPRPAGRESVKVLELELAGGPLLEEELPRIGVREPPSLRAEQDHAQTVQTDGGIAPSGEVRDADQVLELTVAVG